MKIGVGKVIKNKQNWILIIWSMNIKYITYKNIKSIQLKKWYIFWEEKIQRYTPNLTFLSNMYKICFNSWQSSSKFSSSKFNFSICSGSKELNFKSYIELEKKQNDR